MNPTLKENLSKFATPAISGIVLGLVIGLIVNTSWSNTAPESIQHTDTTPEVKSAEIAQGDLITPTLPVVYNTVTDATASIKVLNQKAGFAVGVSEVTVSLPTWVAVREVVGTTAGNILGAGLIHSNAKNIIVDLLRGTNPDSQYQVYLYQDDGNMVFDFERDLLITRDRAPLSAGFLTQ